MLALRRAKKGGFGLCSIAKTLVLFICVAISVITILSHLSLHSSCSFVLTTKRLVIFTHHRHHQQQLVFSPPSSSILTSTTTAAATNSTTTTTDDDDDDDDNKDDDDSIEDHHQQSILEPEYSSTSFNNRVNDFLDINCEVNFFMTWIADATHFGSKELLGIDTLFKSHPNSCLVILSKSMDTNLGKKNLKPFTDLGLRILTISPDYPSLLQNTVALPWYREVKKGKINTGKISFPQHLSDLLRLVVLYKYGGVYLDTDFIILNDFSNLRNAVGAQSMNRQTGMWTRLNGAVMIFDKGHPLLLKFLEEFVGNFDGNKWGHNGPYLVSRVIQSLQDSSTDGDADADAASNNYTILPPVAFYPVDWIKIAGLFQKPKDRAHERWIQVKTAQLNQTSYGIHLWNKLSNQLTIEKGSVLWRLVSRHCVVCKQSADFTT